MKTDPLGKPLAEFARKAGLSPFAIFLVMAIPTTLCAGCALFFADGLFDASDPGVLAISLVVLALFHGAIWKWVKALMR